MSVNKYDSTTGQLTTLASGQRMWVGTKNAHSNAIADNTMPNNCMVCITDDYAEDQSKDPQCEKVNRPAVKMIAHRGWWGTQSDETLIPENSYESLRECANRNFFGVEMDIQKASDGTFWVSHNNNLSSTTSVTTSISDMTETQLKEVKLTDSVCGLPKLDEFLIACRKYNIVPVIELKTETIGVDDIQAILNILSKTGVNNNCFVMSYGSELIKKVHDINNRIPIQLITNSLSRTIIDNAFLNIADTVGFDVNYSAVTAELATYIHEKNSYIIGWTVSGQDQLNDATNKGCDFVETENTINPAILEMRNTSALKINTFPSWSKIEDVHGNIPTDSFTYGTHTASENKPAWVIRPDFTIQGYTVDADTGETLNPSRAYTSVLFKLPENAIAVQTTLDVTTYKWILMCLDGEGRLCNNNPWATTAIHSIYNTVTDNPPVYGYLYVMRVDAQPLTEEDIATIKVAKYTILTRYNGQGTGLLPAYYVRNGKRVDVYFHNACALSNISQGATICSGLPRPATNSVNGDGNYCSVILLPNPGFSGYIAAYLNYSGDVIIDWTTVAAISSETAPWLRGSFSYEAADYWWTN